MAKQKGTRSARSVLANNIKRFRALRDQSQEELAYAAGLHRTYVGAVERSERNISIDNIEKLALALGIAVKELLRDD